MNEWIRLKDEEPEEGDLVLTYDAQINEYRVAQVTGWHDGKSMWDVWQYPPTHWQPLPKPPTD